MPQNPYNQPVRLRACPGHPCLDLPNLRSLRAIRHNQGNSSINASAKIFIPRASGWLMEFSISVL